MNKDNFYKNSLLLTLSNLATGILRFMFSIILSRELGAEGLGLYSLIMPIYDLFCCLICGGMITAISKEASAYYSKKDYANLNKTIHISFAFDLIWALIVAISVFAFAPFISKYLIKDSRTLYSIWAICPALIFVALSSICKGYFYSTSNVKVPALIDVSEKAVRMIVIISLINILSLKNVTYTVTATYIALTIGELLSFILLYVYYKIDKSKCPSRGKCDTGFQLLFNILVVAFPLCINGFLTTALSSFSTLLVPRRLVAAGISYSNALNIIGKFSGMAMNIVYFPIIVIISISTLLVPDISKSLAMNDFYALENRIKEVMSISLLLGICNLVICLCIPESLGKLFFNRGDLASYIKLASYSAPFAYLSISTYSILNGLGKQKAVLINSIITSVIEVILYYVLLGIPSINIYGFGITLLLVSILSFILNLKDIKKSHNIHFSKPSIIIQCCLGVLLYFVLNILNGLIPDSIFIAKNVIIIVVGFSLFIFSPLLIEKSTV